MTQLFEYDGVKRNAGYGVEFSTPKDVCLAMIIVLDLWLEIDDCEIKVLSSSVNGEQLFLDHDWTVAFEWLSDLYCKRTGKFPPGYAK